jgi:hypothetical protein
VRDPTRFVFSEFAADSPKGSTSGFEARNSSPSPEAVAPNTMTTVLTQN